MRAMLVLGAALGALALPAAAQARLIYQTCIKAPAEMVTPCATTASDNAIQEPSQISISPDGSTAYVVGQGVGSVPNSGNVGIFSTAGGLTQTGQLPNAAAVDAGSWPTSSVVSPDGNNVYITALSGVWTYTRSRADGSLSSPSCFGGTSTTCPSQSAELGNAPNRAVISSDGHYVYVVNDSPSADPPAQTSVSEFSRDPATGALTHIGCLSTVSEGSCTVVPSNMLGLQDLVISPDGRHAYGAAYPRSTDGAVIVFSRAPTTGALTYGSCYGQSGGCISTRPGSHIPLAVAITPDGTQMYVSYGNSAGTNNISAYSVDRTSGSLTFAGCIANSLPSCSPSPDEFYDNGQLLPSADGRDLYVMDNAEAIAAYARDPATGVLTYAGCYSWPGRTGFGGHCTNTAAGLFYSTDMTLSPDGGQLYAVSLGNNPWSGPGGSLADTGGGVVDQFRRVASIAAATAPPAILTIVAHIAPGGLSFDKRA
ncbi:MAG TPA: beta-propeller fold lactonase family protein, partial [Solirubrobacteraceae bacterium]